MDVNVGIAALLRKTVAETILLQPRLPRRHRLPCPVLVGVQTVRHVLRSPGPGALSPRLPTRKDAGTSRTVVSNSQQHAWDLLDRAEDQAQQANQTAPEPADVKVLRDLHQSQSHPVSEIVNTTDNRSDQEPDVALPTLHSCSDLPSAWAPWIACVHRLPYLPRTANRSTLHPTHLMYPVEM